VTTSCSFFFHSHQGGGPTQSAITKRQQRYATNDARVAHVATEPKLYKIASLNFPPLLLPTKSIVERDIEFWK